MNDAELLEQARSSDPDTRHRAASRIAHAMEPDGIPLMFEMLGDRDWRVRKAIIEGFLRQPEPVIIGGLLDALHDAENAGKRNSATEALIRIGDAAVPEVLARLTTESDLDVRLSLVNLLGDLRTDEGLEQLLALLDREDDINILSSTVSSIGRYRSARAVRPLVETLQRDDLWLKFHVVEALGDIGDRAALPVILPLYAEKSLRKPVLEAIGKIGDVGTVSFLLRTIAEEEKLNLTALRALVQIAESDKPRVLEQAQRHLIQKMFREAFPPSKIEPLIEHLRATPKREVKSFILKFLGWSADPRALDVLLEYVEQPDSAEVAAQCLIEFGGGATEGVLAKLRSVDDDDTAGLLLRVVNMIAGREAIPTIVGFLDHDNALIRRLAIETLGQIVDPTTVDFLLAKLDDSDVGCQQAAVNSISALVEAFPEIKQEMLARVRRLLADTSIPVKLNSLSIFVNIQGEGYADELLLASKNGDPVIRQKAVSLMGKFDEKTFGDQLVFSLADESPAVRLAAIQALVKLRPVHGITPLISSLEDTDVWIRTAAAQALGAYRQIEALEPLMRHLESDHTPVKIAVIEALGKSESADVRDVLFRQLESEDPEIRRAALLALARIPGEVVFDRLMDCLRSPDWRIRAAAAVSLGQRGDLRALPSLHQTLVSDSDPYVAQSVVVALDRMPDRSSFPVLLKALESPSILDDVSDLFVRHKAIFREPLEQAWSTADSRHEVVIAAILQAMKGAP